MRLFTTLGEVPADFPPSVVAIGKFDGVHTGHRRIIDELHSVAAREGLVPTVVTFDRHPLRLLRPEACPPQLTSNAQKIELIAETGIDATLMLTFDQPFSRLTPREFVEQILVDTVHARVVMVGTDFRFGARGSGTVDTLVELGRELGFAVVVVGDVVPTLDRNLEAGRRVSSTWVRELLSEGRVAEATAVLGYEPRVRGVVVMGAQRGRELGYPTANLSPEVEGFIPADGVYAAWFTVDGTRYGSAVSIGNNPTFEGVPDKQVEAHVLDETIDLYGKTVELAFVEFIRGMVKYSTVEALIEQIGDDERRVRPILGYPDKTVPVALDAKRLDAQRLDTPERSAQRP
jgi:riboflavin kinase/FMN adenylyltransferase